MNVIETVLLDELSNPNTVFVFATSVVSSSWVQWCLENTEYKAVSLERFIAWDTFKTNCISEDSDTGLSQIPSILRKLYARYIVQNKDFKKIIASKFKESASSFAPWLSTVLPSLNSWKKQYDIFHQQNPNYQDDDEDNDYLTLFNDYKNFLLKNHLYETSWIQPSFIITGKKYIIFYPEILDDFVDYKNVLSSQDSIKFVSLKDSNIKDTEATDILFYTNSRTELRHTVLKIRDLHYKEEVPWSKIAFDVPDLDSCRTYIERELSLYCVPYNVRGGVSLCKNSAGHVFEELRDCSDNNFSYDSIRSLLLDGYIPWKNPNANNALVRQGSLSKCLFNFDNRDLWLESLPEMVISSVDQDGKASGYEVLNYYKSIKKAIQKICNAESFLKLREAWFSFRDSFLDVDNFSDSANMILGRCISELDEFIEIERNFLSDEKCGITLDSPFKFFVSELETIKYQPQSQFDGISVFPYKLSASSAYPYHFIINASQRNLTIEYPNLSFLSQKKRDLYALSDSIPVSTSFIKLYNIPFEKGESIFSAAENSFSGFSIASSLLKKIVVDSSEIEDGFFNEEKNILLNSTKQDVQSFKLTVNDLISKKQNTCTDLQKKGFEFWTKAWTSDWKSEQPFDKKTLVEPNKTSDMIRKLVHSYLYESIGNHTEPKTPDKLHISTSVMDSFFSSPRLFFLSRVLNLQEDTLDTDFLDVFDRGKINHMLLHIFFLKYKQIPKLNDEGLLENEDEIKDYLLENIVEAFNESESFNKAKNNSVLVQEIFNSQKRLFIADIIEFLKRFSKDFSSWYIHSTEESFNENVIDKNYMFTGNVDCILSNDDGTELVLIDFKNSEGSIPLNKEMYVNENGELGNFQMPMYLKLWELRESQNRDSKINIDKARFYAIKKSVTGMRSFLRTEDEKDYDKFSDSVENTMEALEEYSDTFSFHIQELVENLTPLPLIIENEKTDNIRVCRIVYNGTGLGLVYEETQKDWK